MATPLVQISGSFPQPARREVINSRLTVIDELSTKPRTIREMQLGNAATIAYVTALDAEAAALRTELKTLPI